MGHHNLLFRSPSSKTLPSSLTSLRVGTLLNIRLGKSVVAGRGYTTVSGALLKHDNSLSIKFCESSLYPQPQTFQVLFLLSSIFKSMFFSFYQGECKYVKPASVHITSADSFQVIQKYNIICNPLL